MMMRSLIMKTLMMNRTCGGLWDPAGGERWERPRNVPALTFGRMGGDGGGVKKSDNENMMMKHLVDGHTSAALLPRWASLVADWKQHSGLVARFRCFI